LKREDQSEEMNENEALSMQADKERKKEKRERKSHKK
jgi:hypothetical protein